MVIENFVGTRLVHFAHTLLDEGELCFGSRIPGVSAPISPNQFGRILIVLQSHDRLSTRVLRQHTSDLERSPGWQKDLRLGGDGRELADVDATTGEDLQPARAYQ